MNCHTLVCTKPGKVELQEQSLPDPGPHQLRIRTYATVISPGTERANVLNLENTRGVFPFEPGYCVAGVVESAGSGVTRFKVGDRVAGKPFGHRTAGNAREETVVKIPDRVSFEEAAFCTLGSISLQGVRKARIEIGERVMILGLGIIGQLAMQLASLNGAFPVVGVDRLEERLRLAYACGASVTINACEPNWQETLRRHTDGQGSHVVIESTGAPDAVPDALKSARKYGRVILLASTRGQSTVNFHYEVHSKAITIIGALAPTNPRYESHPAHWTWQEDAACFMELLEQDKIRLPPLITERVPWQEIETAYTEMLSWNPAMMGTVIQW